ncbi:inactive tyrosine-protein kinase transmembrane receptor ROR1-like [Clytia hemisphaerica]|uniref:Receptor protein-tyrosine kinase n=1 Tax=Clytia hemisphaerica TaxID=252671 RepID=A0A7M5XIY6_9CNID
MDFKIVKMRKFHLVLFSLVMFKGLLSMNDLTDKDDVKHTIQRRSSNSDVCDDNRPCQIPEFRTHPRNISYPIKQRLRCRAVGNPQPIITWRKLNVNSNAMADTSIDPQNKHYRISTERKRIKDGNFKGYREMVVSTMNIESWNSDTNPAVYACVAKNQEGETLSKKSFVTKEGAGFPNSHGVPGDKNFKLEEKCLPLKNSSACWGYLDPTRSVYTEGNIEVKEDMLQTIKKVLAMNQHKISNKCKPLVLPFLCYFNMPYCSHGNNLKRRPQMICKQDCTLLSKTDCQKEFEFAQKDRSLTAVVPQSCDELPSTNCTKTFQEMDRVRNYLEQMKAMASLLPKVGTKVNSGDFCYFDKGEEYLGIENRTVTGLSCLRWKNSNHNFCRNPSNVLRERPWCFTDNNGAFAYCNIQQCAIPDSQTSSILYTIIPCLLFALILSLAIITLAWRRHKEHYYQATPGSPKQLVPRVNPKILELNREDLCDFRMLGDGNIGRVYTADYTGSKDGRTFTASVAVKAIIEKASNQQIQDFVREAETRANFKHENVIALIGVISKEEPLSLIYEYTEFGDLHEYLLRHSPNFSDAHAADNCGPLEFNDLFAIAKQIANGMSYLSSHAFVHKDLAARNCLVAENGIVKISDFSGLCDMYAGDYYRAPGRPPLPVRWMAPEAISQMNFTTASDVWSFSILLWEVFSYGSRPFFGLSNYQAMEHILDSKLLPCPDHCPKPIFEIMAECWVVDPNDRPAFPEIYNNLKSISDVASTQSSGPRRQYTPDIGGNSSHGADIPLHLSDVKMHSSVHSITPPSVRKCQRDLPLGSYRSSMHSRHSSNPSVHSIGHHPGSIHSSSMVSQPRSVPSMMMNNIQRMAPARPHNNHHSLPRDGYHSLNRGGDHHSQNNYLIDNQYPMHAMDHHSISSASSHRMHPMGAYSSYTPSYPPSLTGPPASSVFSRQSSDHPSSKTSESIKSYVSSSQPQRHHSHHSNHHVGHHGNGNAQVYL